GKAEKALEGIKKMLSLEARVTRGGSWSTIDAADLVPGDIVALKSGDKVPADMRLVSVKNLRAEESALTGESDEVEKTTDSAADDAVIGDQKGMVFSGTTITYGEATGVVVATGTNTQLGSINRMMSDVGDKKTPLLRKIDRFGKILAIVIVVLAGAFFAFGLFVRGVDLPEMFLAAISIVVASIPEGLPAIMTITLAMGVQRMARRHAIIRRLPSVETLGAVSVICSDKTGTLTRNEMTVRSVVTVDGVYRVEGAGYAPEGRILRDGDDGATVDPDSIGDDAPALRRLVECGVACNNASIREEEGTWTLDGTPTEGALIALGYKAGLADFSPKRVDSIPFESDHKYMATLTDADSGRVVFLKGAPERVIDMCDRQYSADGEDSIERSFWTGQVDTIAARGERVIACAYRPADESVSSIDHDDLGSSFVLLGLTGIIDPPRDEVIDAIAECRDAGIRVIMITGDHAATAHAIAQQLGIDADTEPITGADLSSMSDDDLVNAVRDHNVFARTSPEHKLRLVEALQKQHLLCAMTGDGVNDAPALKRADIGIAMGIKGTEVTKEAAEMVLTDDNFASIVHAVEEGRTIYDNIKKTILFLLPANGAEASVIIAAILLGLTLPISPVQILWVNMVSAVTLALSLSVEPMERKVMQRQPREPDEPILGAGFFRRVVFVSLLSGGLTFLAFIFGSGLGAEGGDLAAARTLAVNMLVVAHAFYLFTCKKLYESSVSVRVFDSKLSLVSIGLLALLQVAFTYVPFMNTLFGTAPIPAIHWLYLAGGGALVFVVVEIEKLVSRKLSAS
ncbi:MAG: HAD family hydrolase, partial [Spirochaetaceae bacterium]